MPSYPGLRHSVEVQIHNEKETDPRDWAAQYQSYLDKGELATDADVNQDTETGNDIKALKGDDWAVQYAKHCEEKEREFFESNKSKKE